MQKQLRSYHPLLFIYCLSLQAMESNHYLSIHLRLKSKIIEYATMHNAIILNPWGMTCNSYFREDLCNVQAEYVIPLGNNEHVQKNIFPELVPKQTFPEFIPEYVYKQTPYFLKIIVDTKTGELCSLYDNNNTNHSWYLIKLTSDYQQSQTNGNNYPHHRKSVFFKMREYLFGCIIYGTWSSINTCKKISLLPKKLIFGSILCSTLLLIILCQQT